MDCGAPSIGDEPRPRGYKARFAALSGWLEAKAEAERDQLPLWLPVGLGLGIAFYFILPDSQAWIGFLLAAVSLLFACLAIGSGTIWGRALAVFAVASLVGGADAWWEADRVGAPRIEAPRVATFEAEVESLSHVAAAGKVRLVVHPLNAPDLPPRLRLNIDAARAPKLSPGALIETRAWLMPPPPAQVPDAYDFSRAAWFMRLGGSGRPIALKILADPGPSGWRGWVEGVRQRLGDHIRKSLPGAEGEIAVALANGDQDGISKDDTNAMRRSGLAHLLSVSGLHLTAVVGAVMLLTLRLLALSPKLALRFRLVLVAAGAGALAGIAYTILTGSQVPTIRSCIASLLVLGALALGREALTLRLVATGALIILLLWPDSLVGPSFQLSFAAIAAIVILHDHPRIRAFVARREEAFPLRLLRSLAALILTGLVVEAALTPIGLYHFHRAGLYGTFANIVAIPLTTFVIMPAEALALLFDSLGLGAPFWWVTGWAIRLLLAVAHGTGEAPGAVALLPAMADAAFALMVGGALWLGLWRTKWRRWGLVPFAIGAIWALSAPRPDLLVTGDGRHMALLEPDGKVGLLRTRAGDYVRGAVAVSFATDDDLPDIDDMKGAACSKDSCFVTLERGGRPWRILALRTRIGFDPGPLDRACAAADIVVSEAFLPPDCAPRWLKIDQGLLSRTGGLSIGLGPTPVVRTVAQGVGSHPWSTYLDRSARRTRRHIWPAPHR